MQEEETFTVTVQINPGLEPLTVTVVAYDDQVLNPEHAHVFKIVREGQTLGILITDSDLCWQLVEGEMQHSEVDLIGAAIEAHYA